MPALDTLHRPILPSQQADDWRLLNGLNLFRLLLAGLLLVVHHLRLADWMFVGIRPQLFGNVGAAYVVVATACIVLGLIRRPRLAVQAVLGAVSDTLLVSLLVVATGGVSSGTGMLLVPTMIALPVLTPVRWAQAMAVLAALLITSISVLQSWPWQYGGPEYSSLAVTLFLLLATAAVAGVLGGRARRMEARAQAMDHKVADLAELNQTVLETMITGVVVVDARGALLAMNQSGAKLLELEQPQTGGRLSAVAPQLDRALDAWRNGAAAPDEPIAARGPGESEVLVRFRRLGDAAETPVLIALEDPARVRQQAQQLKLASLGRLSASIAHEIRNPLSAIQHATQLLAEELGENPQQGKLLDIIGRQTRRIEVIVRDVLDLSRSNPAPQAIDLSLWLTQARGHYCEAWPDRHFDLQLSAGLWGRFDPDHLQQVVFNLLDNAYLHGCTAGQAAEVTVVARRGFLQGAFIEIHDRGPGIASTVLEHLFEPFFTTRAQGTGLGLYLARELTAYNQAKLTVHTQLGQGSVFRIALISPDSTPP